MQTAKNYIDELATKYPPNAKIADTPQNRELGIAGQKLKGQMYLEVPPQKGPIAAEILAYAKENKIIIRDVNGEVYS